MYDVPRALWCEWGLYSASKLDRDNGYRCVLAMEHENNIKRNETTGSTEATATTPVTYLAHIPPPKH